MSELSSENHERWSWGRQTIFTAFKTMGRVSLDTDLPPPRNNIYMDINKGTWRTHATKNYKERAHSVAKGTSDLLFIPYLHLPLYKESVAPRRPIPSTMRTSLHFLSSSVWVPWSVLVLTIQKTSPLQILEWVYRCNLEGNSFAFCELQFLQSLKDYRFPQHVFGKSLWEMPLLVGSRKNLWRCGRDVGINRDASFGQPHNWRFTHVSTLASLRPRPRPCTL